MYPEICKIGPLTIYSYGLILVLAFGVSSLLAVQEAKRRGFEGEVIFNFVFAVFIAGILGARLFYVIENLNYYLKNPLEIIFLQRGGLSWFGGFILGAAYGVLYLKMRNLSVYKTLDLISPFLALGQAIGRIGCFANGCCFGKASSFGIYFPVYRETLIPTQIYSSLALLLIFVFLRLKQERPHRGGEVIFTYVFLYSLKRFFIEFWRSDNPIVFSGLTLFQLISIVFFLISLIKLIMLKEQQIVKPKT
jgi:phosphatidylglycerol:prolipoprotein diacylglycerol transferase